MPHPRRPEAADPLPHPGVPAGVRGRCRGPPILQGRVRLPLRGAAGARPPRSPGPRASLRASARDALLAPRTGPHLHPGQHPSPQLAVRRGALLPRRHEDAEEQAAGHQREQGAVCFHGLRAREGASRNSRPRFRSGAGRREQGARTAREAAARSPLHLQDGSGTRPRTKNTARPPPIPESGQPLEGWLAQQPSRSTQPPGRTVGRGGDSRVLAPGAGRRARRRPAPRPGRRGERRGWPGEGAAGALERALGMRG